MTTALITHPTPATAVIESEEQGRSALATLPREWAEPVAFFALSKLYLLRTRGPLCVNLRYWISKGLTLDDAKVIFRRLCDPEVSRGHNFENQLMADLAGLVADCLRRRRMLAEQKRRREAAEAPAGVVGEVVRMADWFKAPEPPPGGLGAKHT